jgi:hypothetical protein
MKKLKLDPFQKWFKNVRIVYHDVYPVTQKCANNAGIYERPVGPFQLHEFPISSS